MLTYKSKKQYPPVLMAGFKATVPVFATAVIFSFFINLLMFVSPLYMLQIYDRVIASRSVPTLIGITLIACFLLMVYAALEMLRSRILVRAGLIFDDKIAASVFDAIHRGNLRQPTGGHTQALRDIDSMREFLTGSGLVAFCDVPWFPVFVAASFILHPWYGFIALGGMVVILSLTLLNERVTKTPLSEASRASIRANLNAQATFRNGEVLQAMGMLHALRSRWAKDHGEVLTLQAEASDRAGSIIATTKFFRIFLQTAILGTGAYLAINGEITPGAMIAGSILIGRALQPIELAVGSWKGFVAARGALHRIVELFEVAGEQPERMSLPRPVGGLSIEALVTGVPGQNAALVRGVSLELPAGEVMGVVGPSAAGKSSLVRAIVGVWPIYSGSVRLDGSHIAHWDPHELGQYIGYLPQDVELFSGTVAENIARFQQIDEPSVIAAAEMAGCHEMIQRLPEGYNTQIGDGGQGLSGGQRQRLGLARALYGKPSLVVLDEPNANLDAAGEEALLKALQRLKAAGSSAIIVTHKMSVLSAADKILIMEGGTAKAFGTRDEILRRLAAPKAVVSVEGQKAASLAPARTSIGPSR
jgi:ATP-binding cassette subfamily C protein